VLAPVSEDENAGALAALQGQLGSLVSMFGGGAGGTSANETLALLTSRDFVEGFIADEDLLKVLFSDKWDAQNKKWTVSDARDIPTLQDGYIFFTDTLYRVKHDRQTGLITLTIDWYDSIEGVRWATVLVARLNERMRQRSLVEAEKSIGYLKEELRKDGTVEIRDAVNRLIETQAKRAMFARVRDEFAVRVIDRPLPSDVDRPIRPKRFLMIVVGSFAGLLLGIAIVLVDARRSNVQV
jgi:hypothetical protein